MALYLGEDRIDASSPFGAFQYIAPIEDASYAYSAGDTWSYTGLSVVVPTGHVYIVQIIQTYNGSRPIGIGVHTTTTITSYNAPAYHVQSGSTSQALARGTFLLKAGTWYIWGKAAGAGTNKFAVQGLDFTI